MMFLRNVHEKECINVEPLLVFFCFVFLFDFVCLGHEAEKTCSVVNAFQVFKVLRNIHQKKAVVTRDAEEPEAQASTSKEKPQSKIKGTE